MIHEYDGQHMMKFWKGDACNRVEGFDGTQIAPDIIQNTQPFSIFLNQFCRGVPVQFASVVSNQNGLLNHRYTAANGILAPSTVNASNACYEINKKHVFDGATQLTPCTQVNFHFLFKFRVKNLFFYF